MKPYNPILAACLAAVLAAPVGADHNTCKTTAQLQKRAATFELRGDLETNIAVCLNLADRAERFECLLDAFVEFVEGTILAREQYDARRELCELLGGGAYDPEIDPEDFDCEIDNPYLPFPVGAEWIYEGETEEGLEVITITVLEERREILGVECVSVRDVVTIDGEVLEDTVDWYAQDVDGNVWYFGEISFSFEDGWVADIDGTWLSGVDGAKPGIVMLGTPKVGATYRQEWLAGEAEDAATLLDGDVTVEIGLGVFEECVKTADFVPLEPDGLEHKFFAPGIGLILETKPGSDETLELVSYDIP